MALAATASVLWGLLTLGDATRRRVADRERYSVPFSEIDCEPPPGLDRASFLAEVRYVSGVPESVAALQPELAPRLREAFGKHPWVSAVGDVRVDETGTVHVRLTFRKPVLSVRTEAGPRHVDKDAVLLPVVATPPEVPELAGPIPLPASPAGQPWPDPRVKRAVEVVGSFHPKSLEQAGDGWRLIMPDGSTLLLQR